MQSGEDDGGHEFGNHELNPRTAQTPGFWKNHCKILEDEVGFNPKTTTYESIFGVDVTDAGEVDKGKDKYSDDQQTG